MNKLKGVLINSVDREHVTYGMTADEKKSANLLMDCVDLRAQKLGMEWGRRIRNLL